MGRRFGIEVGGMPDVSGLELGCYDGLCYTVVPVHSTSIPSNNLLISCSFLAPDVSPFSVIGAQILVHVRVFFDQ